MQDKPFSQPCENNKTFILAELVEHFSGVSSVLEIGSGTGQHAVYFAPNLPHLNWHCADQYEYHEGINIWIDEYPSVNLHRPIELTFPKAVWPSLSVDGIFTANTAHIMLAHQAKAMMQCVQDKLPLEGVFCQYGPFTIDGKFSSQSNADFHEKLINSGYGGYRDIAELQAWVPEMTLVETKQLPANNLLLVWHKNS
jgi:hypothetical protein